MVQPLQPLPEKDGADEPSKKSMDKPKNTGYTEQ
jgi:hypothetical protein